MKSFALILLSTVLCLRATVPPTDAEIQLAIEKAMLREDIVPASRIHVDVSEGIVTLTGGVSNLLAGQRAIRIARETLGVRSVVDRIKIFVPPVPDARLAKQVHQALANEPAVSGFKLRVHATNGVVTLAGQVHSWQELRFAERAAKSVVGVRQVVNKLGLQFLSDRSDEEIRTDVWRRLRFDLRVRENRIQVRVQDGDVTLSGEVGSWSERQRARTLAFVRNVRSVDHSRLRVNHQLPTHSFKKQLDDSGLSDAGIVDALRLAIALDPRVQGEVTVRSLHGRVTLTGWVRSRAGRTAAERDARLTHGVREVSNRLVVKSALAPDLDQRVNDTLQKDPILHGADITVTVVGEKVYLNGTVESFFERARAGRLASKIAGVGEIENRLQVDPPLDPQLPPGANYDVNQFQLNLPRADLAHQLRRDIEQQFAAHPEIDPGEIHLHVRHRHVELTGTVDSWRIRRLAEQTARRAGARRVTNSLLVDESFRTE